MLTQKQFEELLALEHEIPGVEFKGSGPRGDDYLRAKVARAVMGMTNRRDGGVVIIGVEERGGVLNPVGLSQNDVGSWRNNDHVSTALANYMSPPPSFHLSIREFRGREVAVLEVHEFTDIPTICKKRYHRDHTSGHQEIVLREGACYIRSRHKPETVEVSSLEHLRELLDLAIEKGVRKFVTQAQKAGMSLSVSNQPNAQELFEKQIENWTSPLIKKIQTRGYWKVIVRPDSFSQDKIAYDALYSLVQNTAVNIFGGGFPNVVQDLPISRETNCIGQEIEAGHFLEIWYLYQSGQFVQYSGLLDDWFRISPDWQPGKLLAIEEVIRQYTGIFVFASRLALTDVYAQDEYIHIRVLIEGLQGRRLYISTPGRVPLRWNYEAQISEFPYEKRLRKEELIANPTSLALQASKEIFHRFGWDAPLASLEGTQSTFYRGS
jgi:Putative DNA-binding domain